VKKLFSDNIFLFCTAAFILAFFFPFLILGKIPIPADSLVGLYHPWRDNSYEGYNPQKFPVKNPLITDPVLQTYPWRYAAIKDIKNTEMPLWNPYGFSGQPLLANLQSAVFSIFNLTFFIFSFPLAWGLNIILVSVLSGIFMFLFLREISLSKPASFFGGLILPFSGFYVAWMTWGTVISVAMFLPLILLSIKIFFNNTSPVWFLILTFACSQIIFAGHLQTAIYILFASFLFTVFLLIKEKKSKAFFMTTLAIFFGLLISSVQLIPSAEFSNISARNLDQGFTKGREDWFLPIQNIIQLIAPDFFGNPATYNYWGVWNYAEFVLYIGLIPLIMSLVGLTFWKKYPYFLILLGLSLILAVENPLSKLPYTKSFFLISSMQPSRIIFLITFSLVVFSSVGFDAFLKEKEKRKVLLSSALILLVVIFLIFFSLKFSNYFPKVEGLNPAHVALRNLVLPFAFSVSALFLLALLKLKIMRKYVILAIIVLTIFDLFRFSYKFTSFAKTNLIFPKTAITDFLSNQKAPSRILATDRRIFMPNSTIPYQIESAGGYDPLYLKDYAKLVSSWNANTVSEPMSFNRIVTPSNIDSPLINILGIRYILGFTQPGDFQQVTGEGITKVYENKNYLPRAFFLKNVVKVQNRDQELEFLLKNSDYSKAVSVDFEYKNGELQNEVKQIEIGSQNLKIETISKENSPIFISNIYNTGWQVYIDNKKSKIYRVNYIFQSVLIPKGSHLVNLIYRPSSFYNGMYISFLSILITFGLSLFLWKKKYQ